MLICLIIWNSIRVLHGFCLFQSKTVFGNLSMQQEDRGTVDSPFPMVYFVAHNPQCSSPMVGGSNIFNLKKIIKL